MTKIVDFSVTCWLKERDNKPWLQNLTVIGRYYLLVERNRNVLVALLMKIFIILCIVPRQFEIKLYTCYPIYR